ncbi:MAG: CBS domain-containing protein [Desulfarculus sp.]|nr:CBS domain-containing protein [Desulfarculus sp.]
MVPPRQEKNAIYFSELLRTVVVDGQGRRLGRLEDMAAEIQQTLPPLTALLVGGDRSGQRLIPWEAVRSLEGRRIVVDASVEPETGSLEERLAGRLLVRQHLLDRQIVDTGGAKLVRVNDLVLHRRNGHLVLSAVEVGARGLLRRAGLLRPADALIQWLFSYRWPENLIHWHLVQPVDSADVVRLRWSLTRLSHLHPADLADILEDLDPASRARLLQLLDPEIAADVLEETEPKVQAALISNLPTEQASDILDLMPSDEAADVLQGLAPERAESLLREMEPEQAEQVRCLLDHDQSTAGGLMTVGFLSLPPETSVGQAFDHLRQESADLDVIYYVYVEDRDGHLLGVVNLRELLASPPEATLAQIMETRVISVELKEDPDQVANIFAKYGLRAVPVLDEQGRLHGVLRFKALLDAVAPHLGRQR